MEIWLVVWLPFLIFPYIGNNHPNWLSYFSEGFKPPTRNGSKLAMSLAQFTRVYQEVYHMNLLGTGQSEHPYFHHKRIRFRSPNGSIGKIWRGDAIHRPGLLGSIHGKTGGKGLVNHINVTKEIGVVSFYIIIPSSGIPNGSQPRLRLFVLNGIGFTTSTGLQRQNQWFPLVFTKL